jgi:hypothetical protein
MNINQFIQQLSLLPAKVKALDAERLRTCEFRGELIVAHPEVTPYVFRNGDWEPITFVPKAKP